MTQLIGNIANCNKLLAWLDGGAPHAVLDMGTTVRAPEKWDDDEDTLGNICGTICCIAGAAFQMSLTPDGSFPPDILQEAEEASMDDVMWGAATWLGLDVLCKGKIQNNGLVLDLFCPDIAYDAGFVNPTPADAAAAVRRVMAGEEAWPMPRTRSGLSFP